MIQSLEDLIDLVNTYHKWVTRTLKLFIVVVLVYGGYKWGYKAAYTEILNYLSSKTAEEDKSKSSYIPPSLHDDQPGKMWVPEA